MAGTLVLEVLQRLHHPVTVEEVVECLCSLLHAPPSADIAHHVLATLEAGVEFGFVQKDGYLYSIPDIGQNDTDDSDDDEFSMDDLDDGGSDGEF